jgi:outer membrane lipoprotein SlyB
MQPHHLSIFTEYSMKRTALFTATVLSLGLFSTGFISNASAQTAGAGVRSTAPTTNTKEVVCPDCGTIASITQKKVKGKATWKGTVGGAVAGGVVGNQVGGGDGNKIATGAGAIGGAIAGREIEKRMNKKDVFEIIVQMNDGTSRTIQKEQKGSLQQGDRVKVQGDTIIIR